METGGIVGGSRTLRCELEEQFRMTLLAISSPPSDQMV